MIIVSVVSVPSIEIPGVVIQVHSSCSRSGTVSADIRVNLRSPIPSGALDILPSGPLSGDILPSGSLSGVNLRSVHSLSGIILRPVHSLSGDILPSGNILPSCSLSGVSLPSRSLSWVSLPSRSLWVSLSSRSLSGDILPSGNSPSIVIVHGIRTCTASSGLIGLTDIRSVIIQVQIHTVQISHAVPDFRFSKVLITNSVSLTVICQRIISDNRIIIEETAVLTLVVRNILDRTSGITTDITTDTSDITSEASNFTSDTCASAESAAVIICSKFSAA